MPHKHWESQLGLRVEAEIDGSIVYVGSDRFLRHKGIYMPTLEGETLGATTIYVAADGVIEGKIEYRDILHPETREVITALLTVEGI